MYSERRELIRLANRDGLNADQIADILTLAEFYLGYEPFEIYEAWRDSYRTDEPFDI